MGARPTPRSVCRRLAQLLAAVVGVMNHGAGTALAEGHVEGRKYQFGTQMGGHGPADAAAAEDIGHHRDVEKACPGRDIRDVSQPCAVWRRSSEIAVYQIWHRLMVLLTHGGNHPAAAARTSKAGGLHQARDPLAPYVDSRRAQFFVNPRRAISTA